MQRFFINIIRITKKAVYLLAVNPRLFFKLLIMHLSFRLLVRWFLPKTAVLKRISGVLFEFDFDYDPKIKEMYFGYYEPEVIEVMRKILRSGDVFIDVGANIGYMSAIGAGFVGKSGQVHSFEPVPKNFQRLKKLSENNPDYKIVANQCALGEKEEIANIDVTNLENIGWNTMVPGLMRKETVQEKLKVPVYRLDNYIRQKGLNNISLIKIDVEGFEFPVLKGLSNYFENTNCRPIIICEVFPYDAYSLLGYKVKEVSEYMKKYNYSAYSPFNINTKVEITELEKVEIVVFKVSG